MFCPKSKKIACGVGNSSTCYLVLVVDQIGARDDALDIVQMVRHDQVPCSGRNLSFSDCFRVVAGHGDFLSGVDDCKLSG